MKPASLYDAGLIKGPNEDLHLLVQMIPSKKSMCMDRI
jgi:hypothetical protein